ncbi:MAG TPA: helix-hairpin-helix domain-containing protein [Myxococcota bacterium]|nr:helix-hairpin-helix domain-containing protein [Myxococcota bacterium]
MNRNSVRGRSRALLSALALGLALATTSVAAPALAAAKLSGVVNVNTASAEQLALLPGVGESRAREIIAARQKQGGFKRVEDLLAIKGIGEASLAKLRPYVSLSGETTLRAQ